MLVLSYNPQTYLHVVRDEAGREWTIKARQNLDAGSEYQLYHRWLPADDPEVVAKQAGYADNDRQNPCFVW